MGIIDVDLALAVVRAVQPVEVCNAVCDTLAVLVHNVHAIVDEILCAAADHLGFPQSAWVIGVGCGSCTVAVTGLLSAIVVGVGLIPGGQRVAVGIISVGGNGIADRFGKQAVVGIVGIGGDRAVSVHAGTVAVCIIGIGDAVLALGFRGQSAQPVIDIGGGDRVAAEQGLGLGALIAVGIVGIGKFADDDIFPVGIQQGVDHAGDEVGFVIGIGGGDSPRRLTCPVAVCIIGIGGLDAVCGDRSDAIQQIIGIGRRADRLAADRQRKGRLSAAVIIGVGLDAVARRLGQDAACGVVGIGDRLAVRRGLCDGAGGGVRRPGRHAADAACDCAERALS